MSRPDARHTSDPQALDPLESVRSHPQWYFRQGAFSPSEMAALLTDEALSHGSSDLTISQVDGWWTATSSSDWLSGDRSAFFAPTPDPERGPNSTRVEVLLTAFCSRVITAAGGHVFDVAGTGVTPPAVRELLAQPHWGRAVAFQPPQDDANAHRKGSSVTRKLVLVTEQNLSQLLDESIHSWPTKVRRMREAIDDR